MSPINITKSTLQCLFITLLALGCVGCFSKGDNPADPYESYNRKMYSFNVSMDDAFLKPISKGYRKVVPKLARHGVSNFFLNLNEVPTAANDVFQLKPLAAISAAWRFAINSTVGILGIFDVASWIGMQRHHNDLGITFAKLGDRNSAYFVVPFYGPSTVRDAFGATFDFTYFSAYPVFRAPLISYGVFLFGKLNSRANLIDTEEIIEDLIIDPYIFQRDAFMQNRKYMIALLDNKEPTINVNVKPADPFVEDPDDPFVADDEEDATAPAS